MTLPCLRWVMHNSTLVTPRPRKAELVQTAGVDRCLADGLAQFVREAGDIAKHIGLVS